MSKQPVSLVSFKKAAVVCRIGDHDRRGLSGSDDLPYTFLPNRRVSPRGETGPNATRDYRSFFIFHLYFLVTRWTFRRVSVTVHIACRLSFRRKGNEIAKSVDSWRLGSLGGF